MSKIRKSPFILPAAGTMTQRARLYSGLILMTYAITHFSNHALGHYSVEAMDAVLKWNSAFWQSYPGIVLLYGSFITHICLGFVKIATLGTFRLPPWQIVQIAFGLAIPYFLASHLVFTRGAEQEIGLEVDYAQELGQLWPGAAFNQSVFLLIVWVHGCIGVHFWLRETGWYRSALPYLAGFATFLPTLSITGWIVAAKNQAETYRIKVEEGSQALFSEDEIDAAHQALATVDYVLDTMRPAAQYALWCVYGVGALLVLTLVVRFIRGRLKKRLTITYGDGSSVSAIPGMTLLDVSRSAGVSHMSVCGGRARCSTCRTLVTEGLGNLSAPNDAEKKLLTRLNASPDIRLACQATITGNVKILPLIQPKFQAMMVRNTDPLGWGVERHIAVFFLDIRGFSSISEKSLPYDVVFILNSFFAEVTDAIEESNGYVDKFMGDGLMALFGLDSSPSEANRDALNAAVQAKAATDRVSKMLTQHIDEPIRIGIGIHSGMAVVGRIGKTSDQSTPTRLTAIGDTVNIAARLESATKEFACPIVISKTTADLSQVVLSETSVERAEITVHNISTPIEVVAISNPDDIRFEKELAVS